MLASKTLVFSIMSILMFIPVLAHAQVYDEPAIPDELGTVPGTVPGGIIPDDDTIGPVATVDELMEAHSDVTDIMISNADAVSNTGFVSEEVFLEGTYVNEDNMNLVLILDPVHLLDPIDSEDIMEELNLTIPIEVTYGYLQLQAELSEATPCPDDDPDSLLCYWWSRYVDRCLPTWSSSRCPGYVNGIEYFGYSPPVLLSTVAPPDDDNDGIPNDDDQCDSQPETVNGYQDTDGCPDTVPVLPDGIVFQEDFENGFGSWAETGQQEWQTGIPDDYRYITGLPNYNKVAEADDCDDEACILTMVDAVDLSSYDSATLEFHRFVDASHDGTDEYLAVQVGNNGVYTEIARWTGGNGDDHTWHLESYDLSDYLKSGFKVRFLTEQSSSTEDVGVDNVVIRVDDRTECVLSIAATLNDNGSISAQWNDCGEDIRRYKGYLYKDGSYNRYLGSIYTNHLLYTPSSSSPLSEGSDYTIKVRAQYADDLTYTERFESNVFTIPITDTTPPVITVPSTITVQSSRSSGTAVSFEVSATDDVDGAITPTCNRNSGDTFPVGTTRVTCSGEDQQGNIAYQFFDIIVSFLSPPTPSTVFYGGDEFRTVIDTDGGLSDITGTVAVGATNVNGTRGLVTAGHVNDLMEGETFVHYEIHDDNGGTTIARDRASHIGYYADAMFVPITEPNITVGSQIRMSNGTIFDVTQGTLSEVSRGDKISIYGIHNQNEGYLLFKNATLSLNSADVFINLGISHYTSQHGDSGAAIIHHDGDDSEIIGVHLGALCRFTVPGETNIVVDISNIESLCSGDYAYYKAFSSWENVKSAFNLQ